MKVAGCTILYNPKPEVLENISTYIKKIETLYIFDNTNNNNFLKELKNTSYFKKIVYLTEKRNMGIAYALNICCNKAIDDGFDWILTMDQDSKFGTDLSVDELKKNISEKTAIIAPHYDMNQFYSCSSLVVMTSGNLLNLSIFRKIGGFKEELFIDMVDYEYCLNARMHNYDIIFSDTSILIHSLGHIQYKKIFGKKIFYTNHSATRRYFITRNRLILYKMYKDYFYEFCNKELSYSRKEILKVLLFEEKKLDKLRMYFKAKRDYKMWSRSYEKRRFN